MVRVSGVLIRYVSGVETDGWLRRLRLRGTGALEAELGKCGAALHGLRKTLLPRSWDPRCSVCGVRHKDIEIHTCKFWQEWASAASVTGE